MTYLPRWIPRPYLPSWNIACNYCPGAHHRPAAYRDPFQDKRTRAHENVILDYDRSPSHPVWPMRLAVDYCEGMQIRIEDGNPAANMDPPSDRDSLLANKGATTQSGFFANSKHGAAMYSHDGSTVPTDRIQKVT